MVGKIYKFNDREYKVLASADTKYVMAECVTDGDFKGDIIFLCDVVVDGNVIKSPTTFNYFVTKKQFYNEATENKTISENASAIRKRYYKIPKVLCELVATAYQNNM